VVKVLLRLYDGSKLRCGCRAFCCCCRRQGSNRYLAPLDTHSLTRDGPIGSIQATVLALQTIIKCLLLAATVVRCCLQASQDKVVTHTTSFMTGLRVERNAVFHAVVLLKGERVNWRAFESKRAKAVEDAKGDMKAMNNVTLDTFSTMK